MTETLQSNTRVVDEIIVEDDIDALNTALERVHAGPQDVVAILQVPGISPAIGDSQPKLRVLYWRSA